MELTKLHEPDLLFGYGERSEDPRDGLTLFGPLEKGKPYGIKWGVVGTSEGIRRFGDWVKKVRGPICNDPPDVARPPFPGFDAVFGVPWGCEPVVQKEVDPQVLRRNLYLSDKHQRVYNTVELFSDPIIKAAREEESAPDIWFVVVPDEVYKYCRPKSSIELDLRIQPEYRMSTKKALELRREPSLFNQENIDSIPYEYEVQFHNQIKARLLKHRIVTQIIRESTVAHLEVLNAGGRPTRDLDEMQSAIAWNISTTVFYKAGGTPWKVGTAREGVCYVGLVFKENPSGGPQSACCAAQMFLDSGDGVVFRGALGPWHNPKRGTFHLNQRKAQELIEIAVRAYKQMRDETPRELFIHGRTSFNDEEWMGFQDGCGQQTRLVGVRIKNARDLKLYRKGRYPVLRGLALLFDEKFGYLCTRGFVPRLQTCVGLEVPRPLEITICRGEAELARVLKDIMTLTKLNYNACMFGDGEPVTLRFANAVGEILTAGPVEDVPPLPFKFYI